MAFSNILGGVALSVVRGLLPTRSADVVAITAFGGFLPLFPQARPLQASIWEGASIMEHPLETGSVIADHIVYRPTEIELPLICVGEAQYRSTYALLRATFQLGTRLTIRTRTGTYPNMVICEMPHEESAAMANGITLRLWLKEARFVTPVVGLAPAQVSAPAQASTADRGSQQTRAPSAPAAASVTATAAESGGGAAPRGSTLYQWAYGT